jgi:hypothetical protein
MAGHFAPYRPVQFLGSLSFTSCWENKINEVSEDYFSVIKNVLKETTGWTEEKNKYLCSQLLKTYFFGYLIELPLIFLPF